MDEGTWKLLLGVLLVAGIAAIAYPSYSGVPTGFVSLPDESLGPGSCDSEDSCINYCVARAEECRGFCESHEQTCRNFNIIG